MFISSLIDVLGEYDRILKSTPTVLLPLMKPYCERVDEAMKPGLVSLSWTSLNIDTCKWIENMEIILSRVEHKTVIIP